MEKKKSSGGRLANDFSHAGTCGPCGWVMAVRANPRRSVRRLYAVSRGASFYEIKYLFFFFFTRRRFNSCATTVVCAPYNRLFYHFFNTQTRSRQLFWDLGHMQSTPGVVLSISRRRRRRRSRARGSREIYHALRKRLSRGPFDGAPGNEIFSRSQRRTERK